MNFNVFDIWYVNNLPTDSAGVYLYTPDRGQSITLNGGTVIEVIGNKITKTTKNALQTSIPTNGYIIYYGKDAANDQYISDRFKVGSLVELSYNAQAAGTKAEVTQITAAPTLTSKNTKLFGSLNKNTKNNWNNTTQKMDFNIFEIWYINTNPIDSSGVYLYTPEKGTTLTAPVGHAVTVQNKDTDNIIKNAVAGNQASIAVAAGTNVTVEGNGINLNAVDDMISAGPFLVNNGVVITK